MFVAHTCSFTSISDTTEKDRVHTWKLVHIYINTLCVCVWKSERDNLWKMANADNSTACGKVEACSKCWTNSEIYCSPMAWTKPVPPALVLTATLSWLSTQPLPLPQHSCISLAAEATETLNDVPNKRVWWANNSNYSWPGRDQHV